MKYCEKCEKEFETEDEYCPTCGAELTGLADEKSNEYEAAEIVSTMMMTGIL